MRRVSYSSVLQLASQLWLGDPSPAAEDAATLNSRIVIRGREFWRSFMWPEWTVVEKRTFRAPYDNATTYAAGDEIYYAATDTYYQAVRGSTGNLPVVGTATNSAYWACAKTDYSGLGDYSSTATYAAGDQVFYPVTRKFYQCYAATTAGQAPDDGVHWGELVEFERNISYTQSWEDTVIGEVQAVYDKNPKTHQDAHEQVKELFDNGVVVRGSCNVVWVKFRLPAPSWSGAAWSATTDYDGADQVYYSGDFWKATENTSAGESPVSAPSKWLRLDFPEVLRDMVAQAVYADMLRVDGQTEKAPGELKEAYRLRAVETDVIERQEGQGRGLNVRTR